jgi:hypothetical protein
VSRHQTSAQPKFDMPDDISAQLRLAEERISELEANVRYYEERADRAERWVYKVWVEIEQKFFGGDAIRPSPSPPAQSVDDPDMMLGEDCFIFRDADRKALAS